MGLGMAALAGCATTPADVHQEAAADNDRAADQVALSLYSKDAAVREAAIAELLKMKDLDAATEDLLNATLSPDPAVRGDVGAALVFNRNTDLDFYAITLVADKDATVRKRVAEGLAAAGRAGPYEKTRAAGIYLWGLEQDEDAEVRAAAAQGLGEIGLVDPMDFALTALREDPEPRVRAAAAQGLGAPARMYLAGERGPDWGDADVQKFLTNGLGQRPPTPVQTRGEEIVTALCKAARTDDGEYVEAQEVETWFGRELVEEKHYVSLEAATALTLPTQPPRADVAAAQAAALARAEARAPKSVEAPRIYIHPLRGPGD
jgi:hypothetical protein